jgi:hypothetical protein
MSGPCAILRHSEDRRNPMSMIEDAFFNKYRDMGDELIAKALRVLEKHHGEEMIDWMGDDDNEINTDEPLEDVLNCVVSIMSDDAITAAQAELETLDNPG